MNNPPLKRHLFWRVSLAASFTTSYYPGAYKYSTTTSDLPSGEKTPCLHERLENILYTYLACSACYNKRTDPHSFRFPPNILRSVEDLFFYILLYYYYFLACVLLRLPHTTKAGSEADRRQKRRLHHNHANKTATCYKVVVRIFESPL